MKKHVRGQTWVVSTKPLPRIGLYGPSGEVWLLDTRAPLGFMPPSARETNDDAAGPPAPDVAPPRQEGEGVHEEEEDPSEAR